MNVSLHKHVMNVSWTWHECVMDMFSSQWCDLRLVHHPVIAAVETTAVKVSSAGFEPADHRLGWLLQRLLHPDPGNRIITAGLSPEMELSPEVGRVRIPRAPGDVVLDPDLRIHLAESLKHLFRDLNNNLLKDFLLVESLTSISLSSLSSSLASSSPDTQWRQVSLGPLLVSQLYHRHLSLAILFGQALNCWHFKIARFHEIQIIWFFR